MSQKIVPSDAIEVLRPDFPRGEFRTAMFDFDGTLSLIRRNWQAVMIPMMVDVLAETGSGESREQLHEHVEEFVMRLNGKQTIYQMMQLADEVKARGASPRDPLEYKHQYHDLLWEQVGGRIDALREKRVTPDEMTVPGSRRLLEQLRDRGVTLYLASGTDLKYVRDEVSVLGLSEFFGEHIYGALDDYRSFSKAMIIERIIKDMNVGAHQLLAFGDGFVEIEETRRAGGVAVGVASDEEARQGVNAWKRERLIRAGADIIIGDYRQQDELLALLGLQMKDAPLVSLERLEFLLAALPKLSIGLVGDLFLDRYLEIDPEMSELSIETGLEAYQVTRIRNCPGALGTIMNNLTALGVGRLVPVTVLGDDGQAYDLLHELGRMPVDASHVIRDAGRLTPTYTKPLRHGTDGVWRELNRIDLRNKAPMAKATEARLCDMLADVFAATDGLIVLDQVNEEGWGVIAPAVRERLAALADSQPDKLMFVDSRAHIAKFRRGTLKPNVHECLAALGRRPSGTEDEPASAARDFAQLTGCPLYCTVGERGILVANPEESPVLAPGYPVAGPVDVVGAGDSATAGMVSALLAGANRLEAAAVGNLVASITVQQLGTTGTASPAQVLDRWREVHA